MKLEGKVALITGAGSGIGRAIAQALGAEGALVALNDIRDDAVEAVAAEITAAGGRATAVVRRLLLLPGHGLLDAELLGVVLGAHGEARVVEAADGQFGSGWFEAHR